MDLGVQSSNDILFINFNQDYSCLSIGSRHGYRIYNSEPFGKYYSKSDGGIGIVEMLFNTSLIALVGSGEQPQFSPRKLQILNTKRQSVICELTFVSAILTVKLNRKRLVILLEEQIYVYDISNMKLIHTIDTLPNPNGLMSLSSSVENGYLAYPNATSNQSSGDLVLFDTITFQAITIIQAHKSNLGCMNFSHDGTLLATASDKGTVIRVFQIPSGQKLYQFRRGTYPAKIHSISFNTEKTLLAVSSDTDTVHVFKLKTPQERAAELKEMEEAFARESGPKGTEKRKSVFESIAMPLSAATLSLSSYIVPEKISELWEPQRDFAHARLPVSHPAQLHASPPQPSNLVHPGQQSSMTTFKVPLHTICGLTSFQIKSGQCLLMVATSEGYFYHFGVDERLGGACALLKQYSLL